MAADRSVLVHYHIFKNAGSSVDFALVRSFGSGWASFEGRHAEDVQTSEQLRRFLEDRPEIVAEARIEDLEQAKAVIESWGIVGIVEDYKTSTRRFQAAYAPHFPSFDFIDVRAN